ncbi:MFS general substrate transporter, partial [Aureobasidium melanogenum]
MLCLVMYHGCKDKDGPRQAVRRAQGLGLAEAEAIRKLPDVMARVQHGMGHERRGNSLTLHRSIDPLYPYRQPIPQDTAKGIRPLALCSPIRLGCTPSRESNPLVAIFSISAKLCNASYKIMPLDSEHFVMLQSDNLCRMFFHLFAAGRIAVAVIPISVFVLQSISCRREFVLAGSALCPHNDSCQAFYVTLDNIRGLLRIMNHSFTVPCANDLFDSLVREFHILLHTDMVLLDALVEAGEVVGPILADVTRILGDRLASVTLLEVIPAAKDRECQDQDGNPGDLCSDSSADFGVVQAKSEDECTNDLSSPVEGVVQSSSPRIEVREVKSIELHCIKPIGGEEHREKTNYVWVASDCLPKSHQLRLPGQRSTTSRQDNEADIGSIGDCATTSGVDVLTKGNLSRLPMTAPRLKIIQNQEMYLPLESSGGTCKDVEACVLSVAVAKERSHVDAVTQTTKGQTESDADVVDDTTGKETLVHCVKSNVGLVSSVSRNLTTSAHTRQSIEHARAQEADESDNH